MTKYVCTLFDSNYIHLGLALYDSLIAHFQDFHLWILAMDEKCQGKLESLALKNVTVLGLKDIEAKDVLEAKSNRTWQEYCWTLSPVLPSYILGKNPQIDHIAYLDSDICFYSSPQPIYDEIGNRSIMIIPHRFPERLRHLEVNGVFNVQMMFFRRDKKGLECLKRWRSQCLAWCYYRLEDGKMGDQKYLDEWPSRYGKDLCVLECVQAGVALWNAESYEIQQRGSAIFINGKPLIFYHFHQFKYFSGGYYVDGIRNYAIDRAAILPVYLFYIRAILAAKSRYKFQVPKVKFARLSELADKKLLEANTVWAFVVGRSMIFLVKAFRQVGLWELLKKIGKKLKKK